MAMLPPIATGEALFAEGPRKAIIGTSVFSVFDDVRPWEGMEKRLEDVRTQIDAMAADAHRRYGRGLDLAVLPENSLNPRGGGLLESAIEFDATVQEAIGAKAREHNTYVVVSFNRIADRENGVVNNVAALFDRSGEVAGIYEKVFCIAPIGSNVVEGGKEPGTDFPVFDTDFARLGILICWDMGFEQGFEAYDKAGVELIVWPTMSPQTVVPRLQCYRYGMHLVSATPRDNASIFDPTGNIIAQVREPDGVVTQEIDFDYRLMHWQPDLNNGEALRERFGDRVGFRYSTTEDTGIFWSNDPGTPIRRMLQEAGFATEEELKQHTLDVLQKVRPQ